MASELHRLGMEPVLEWVLLLSVTASGLCFLGVGVMVILSAYRKRKAAGAFRRRCPTQAQGSDARSYLADGKRRTPHARLPRVTHSSN